MPENSLSAQVVRIDVETRGQLSVRQYDGTTSNWTFTNWNGQTGTAERYNNDAIRFTSGINYGGVEPISQGSSTVIQAQRARPDQNYPLSIRALDLGTFQRGFEVRWRYPLTVDSQPETQPPAICHG